MTSQQSVVLFTERVSSIVGCINTITATKLVSISLSVNKHDNHPTISTKRPDGERSQLGNDRSPH